MVSTETTAPAWDETLLKDPHAVADKRTRVRRMFAAIAPSYDLNNRLHSLWMDQKWRRRAVQLAELKARESVVDVACGTGDLTTAFAAELRRIESAENLFMDLMEAALPERRATVYAGFEHHPQRLGARVTGIDFTFEMLPLAQAKSGEIPYVNGDATALPLPDGSTDVVSIAFGIRNVADPAAAIREFYRVLRPGGRLIILEFSLPTNPILRGIYNFYFRHVLPRTATLISGDKTGAYKYLPQSVNTFIGREGMMKMMTDAGFRDVSQHPLTFGVCVCYRGRKLT